MLPLLLEKVVDLGYTVFTDGLYNLNLIGIRNSKGRVNAFDDRMVAIYRDESGWIERTWAITTDPGLYYLKTPMNLEGTAILCEGQHRKCFKLGKHKGEYDALVQAAPVLVWRDSNKDEVLNYSGEQKSGMYGINIHRATYSGTSSTVEKWSAGCQVFANSTDFTNFMALCKKSAATWGETFTYTLIKL